MQRLRILNPLGGIVEVERTGLAFALSARFTGGTAALATITREQVQRLRVNSGGITLPGITMYRKAQTNEPVSWAGKDVVYLYFTDAGHYLAVVSATSLRRSVGIRP